MIIHADLHVHSIYSGNASDWYLQLAHSLDSYNEPEKVFVQALKSGQTFVTLTDHDQIEGSLRLQERYPERVFSGVEFTVYFPEDHCKVHILVYGLDIQDYEELMTLRQDIYQFRAYLQQHQLTYSVAHALMALDRKLSRVHLEKLVLLFDVFEGINGSQLKIQNQTWVNYLHSLTPNRIDDLYHRYRIEPISPDPWRKGLTGGSDDHAGLFIGRTYTEAKAASITEYLEAIRNKRSVAGGEHSTFRDLSSSILKVAFETAGRQPIRGFNSPLAHQVASHVFEGSPVTFITELQSKCLKLYNRFQPDPIIGLASDLVDRLLKEDFSNPDSRSKQLYDCLTDISDKTIRQAINHNSLNKNDDSPKYLLQGLKSPLAGLILSLPFFTSLGFMNASRHLVNDFGFDSQTHGKNPHVNKRILWFSDSATISNLVNGLYDPDITFVTINPYQQVERDKQILLPIIGKLSVGAAEEDFIPIPSLLRSLDQLANLQPDEIIISTTGPVGLIGLLLAKLLKTPSIGIPQEDLLTWQLQTLNNPQASEWVEKYVRWFFTQVNQVIDTQPDFMMPNSSYQPEYQLLN